MWLQGLLSWARAQRAPHEGHLVDRAGLTWPPLGSPAFVPKVLTVASGVGQGRAAVARVFCPRTHGGKAVLPGVVHRQCARGLVAGPWPGCGQGGARDAEERLPSEPWTGWDEASATILPGQQKCSSTSLGLGWGWVVASPACHSAHQGFPTSFPALLGRPGQGLEAPDPGCSPVLKECAQCPWAGAGRAPTRQGKGTLLNPRGQRGHRTDPSSEIMTFYLFLLMETVTLACNLLQNPVQ